MTDIDEAVTVMTGLDAGKRGDDQEFPPDSVNARVEETLVRYAALRRELATEEKND